MTPTLLIALRFLSHRKRAVHPESLRRLFGVGIFICMQAQTQGFAQYFIDSTLGSNGALILRSRFRIPCHRVDGPSEKLVQRRIQTTPTLSCGNYKCAGDHANQTAIFRGRRLLAGPPRNAQRKGGIRERTSYLFGIEPAFHIQTTIWPSRLFPGVR